MKVIVHAVTSGLSAGLVALSLMVIPAHADHKSDHSISSRIAKLGTVCVAGDECETAVRSVVTVSSGPRSGEEVYNAACTACHTTGAAGAPKIGDSAAWGVRVNTGLDMLLTNAINGIGGMPVRGLCMDCSDDELEEAIEYIVDNSL